jgi:putative salt-induced outer membrane protein
MKKSAVFVAVSFGLAPVFWAADVPSKNWKNEGQVSFLSTKGNSQSRTVGAADKFNWAKDKEALELWADALNVESDNARTSERYSAGEKGERKLTDRNYIFERGLWESNRFAGFSHRYDVSLGLGRELLQTAENELISELGVGYINEQLIDVPRNDFASGRAYAKYLHHFSPSATFFQDGEYIHDFDNPNGYRVNTETALTAGLSTHLALKLSYTWKHVHEPPMGFKRDDTTTLVSLLINY